MSAHPSEIIRSLFRGIGQPENSERERLDRLKRNCIEYRDPDACYLVLEMGNDPVISWSHNTENHFGPDHRFLNYRGYLCLIHPSWTIPYYGYGQIAYGIAAFEPDKLMRSGITYTIKVPLLGGDGKYYWYDQISIPGTLDPEGKLVSHLNYYRRLARYESLIPGPPMLYSRGNPDKGLLTPFREKGRTIVAAFLEAHFSIARQNFLQRYRVLPAVLQGNQPDRKTAAKAMGMSIVAYDRIQQRIRREVLNTTFEGFAANTAHDFALFLNNFFP